MRQRTKRHNPLLDIANLSIVKEQLTGLNPAEIDSWDQVEMWAAINGKKVDENLFKFLAVGSVFFVNLRNMLYESLKEPTSLDQYVNNVDNMHLLYVVSTTDQHSANHMISKDLIKCWLNSYGPSSTEAKDAVQLCDAAFQDLQTDRFKLLKIIDMRFPVLLAKFYDKHKHVLHRFDDEFVRFVFDSFKCKAESNPTYLELYDTMLKERERQQKITMFMN